MSFLSLVKNRHLTLTDTNFYYMKLKKPFYFRASICQTITKDRLGHVCGVPDPLLCQMAAFDMTQR